MPPKYSRGHLPLEDLDLAINEGGAVIKGILWQFYKLGLKVPSGRDKNDGISHFSELGSSWPGEAKTWPKIALRVGGRAEKYCVGGRAAGRYWAARPPTQNIPPVLQHVVLFLATFWPLLASRSRVRQNDFHHRFCLGKIQLLSPTCLIANGSL